MAKKYVVQLTDAERTALLQTVATGRVAARTLTRAHILLKADTGEGRPSWTDQQMVEAFEVSLWSKGSLPRYTGRRRRSHRHTSSMASRKPI